jgi:hypothetical protein
MKSGGNVPGGRVVGAGAGIVVGIVDAARLVRTAAARPMDPAMKVRRSVISE